MLAAISISCFSVWSSLRESAISAIKYLRSSSPYSISSIFSFELRATHFTLLFTSATSNTLLPSSFSSCSSTHLAIGFRRPSPLPLFNKPIWNWNLLVCSKTQRIDVRLTDPPLRCGASSNGNGIEGERSLRQWIELLGEVLSTAFPVWVALALGCLLGLLRPASFDWVQPRWTVLGITLTMLGMGMTLTLDELRGALAMPKELISGFLLQHSISSFITLLFERICDKRKQETAAIYMNKKQENCSNRSASSQCYQRAINQIVH